MFLTKTRLSELSGLSVKGIDRLIAIGIFTEGLHYQKVSQRKILFDESTLTIANLKGKDDDIYKEQCDLGELISEWAKGQKVHRVARHERKQKES
jgi:hypothetical protein